MKKVILLFSIILVAVSFVLVGCGEPEPEPTPAPKPAPKPAPEPAPSPEPTPAPGGPKYGGILRIIVAENPTNSIGVPANLRGQSPFYSTPCIEPLLAYNKNGDAVGVLATDWEIAPDASYIDFTLRQGVKFHDGTDFNAEAAKWNLDYNMSVPVAGTDRWKSVEVLGDYAIRLNLNFFENTLIQGLSGSAGQMISPTAFKANGMEWADWNPVATGPFKYKGYETDKYLEYERFDDYWGGKPYLEGVKYTIIADTVTAQLALEAGEGDMIYMIGRWTEQARDLVPRGYKAEGTTFGMRGLVPDSGNPDSTLANVKLREAVEYSIDRPKIAKAIGYGYFGALEQAAAPHTNGWIPDYKGRSYDPEKAKQILAEAGHADGFKTTIYAGVHLTGDEIEAIQAYMEAVGIEVNVEIISIGKWLELERNGWNNAYYSAGLTCMSTEANYGSWLEKYWVEDCDRFPNVLKSPERVEAMRVALIEPDVEKQKELYQEVNRILMKEAMVIPLWYDPALWTMHTYVMDSAAGGWVEAPERGFGKAWLDK